MSQAFCTRLARTKSPAPWQQPGAARYGPQVAVRHETARNKQVPRVTAQHSQIRPRQILFQRINAQGDGVGTIGWLLLIGALVSRLVHKFQKRVTDRTKAVFWANNGVQ
jgi:hypothetical protein